MVWSTRLYTAAEVDVFAAYCVELDACFYLPYDSTCRGTVQLRFDIPPATIRASVVNWARRDSRLRPARLAGDLGAIAQLGERVPGRHEVAGSSPAGSTGFVRELVREACDVAPGRLYPLVEPCDEKGQVPGEAASMRAGVPGWPGTR